MLSLLQNGMKIMIRPGQLEEEGFWLLQKGAGEVVNKKG